jgi:hypothetical protein
MSFGICAHVVPYFNYLVKGLLSSYPWSKLNKSMLIMLLIHFWYIFGFKSYLWLACDWGPRINNNAHINDFLTCLCQVCLWVVLSIKLFLKKICLFYKVCICTHVYTLCNDVCVSIMLLLSCNQTPNLWSCKCEVTFCPSTFDSMRQLYSKVHVLPVKEKLQVNF